MMAKKWIRCDAFLQENEDVRSVKCLTAILNGKIDIYTEAGRKLINTTTAQIKGPSTKPEIDKAANEYADSIGEVVRAKVGPTADPVFEKKSFAKLEALNVRSECEIGVYYFLYPADAVLDDFHRFKKLIDCPKHLQLQELAKFMFKYEDAVRCFGLAPADNAPVPAAGVQDAAVVEVAPALAAADKTENGGQEGQKRKTPAELLAMHKSDPTTWTRRKLAETFCPLPADAPYNSKKSWLQRELKKVAGR